MTNTPADTELQNFLSAYRSTPHASTNVAPIKLLLNPRSNCVSIPSEDNTQDYESLHKKAQNANQKAKTLFEIKNQKLKSQ